jgi:hypothetical protein
MVKTKLVTESEGLKHRVAETRKREQNAIEHSKQMRILLQPDETHAVLRKRIRETWPEEVTHHIRTLAPKLKEAEKKAIFGNEEQKFQTEEA